MKSHSLKMKRMPVLVALMVAGLLMVTAPSTAWAAAFAPKADYSVGDYSYSVATADLDGDGDQDLATADYNSSGTVSVLLNNADGTFATKADYSVRSNPRSVVAADLDGDGDQDLATANKGSNTVSVLLNNGDGTFATKTDHGVGTNPQSVAAADLDGDGDQDLATANYVSSNVSVLLNNGDGTFRAKADYGVGGYPSSVAAADLDGDGVPDLATANEGSDTVSVRLNNTTGPRADLTVTQSDSADPATVGENLTYTLTVTNQGPATATNTTVTDRLAASLSYVSATSSRGNCSESGGIVSCSLGTLARGATATVQIVVEPTASASPSVSNTARVKSDRADFEQADNSDTEKTAINRAPAATDDAYTAEEDQTLSVAAPGVLDNDTDADRNGLTAEVASNPEHGTLFLRQRLVRVLP